MAKTELSGGVSPVHVGRALESLRNSDFNSLSAIGEVIDNSIEADAKVIKIKVTEEEIRGRTNPDLTEIAFGDDGYGMDRDTLHCCLQLGFSSTYNDRKGIGRFGVGMTLSAITQCTRIEVYSKPKGGEWNYTYLDLEETKGQSNPIIPEPTKKEIPKGYRDCVKDYGTLVVWKNLDREDTTKGEMDHWIARTYRKFIGHEIIEKNKIIPNPNRTRIFLNDNEISAFDPLYVTKTKYNNDVAELDAPVIIQEEIHSLDPPLTKKHGASDIIIRMSLLPKKWRPKAGSGGSEENKARYVPKNEGISILRNNREVFYGHIPYYRLYDRKQGRGFIDLDRFWGCEISFNADLDHWFSVKNVKVGARPLPELREKIEQAINSTIHAYRKEIRDHWKQVETAKQMVTGGAIRGTEDAENTLKKNIPTKSPSPELENDITLILKRSGETKEEVIRELKQKLSDQPYAFFKSDQIDRRGPFVDIASRGDRTLITLNMNHPFFQKFFAVINEIEGRAKKLGKQDDELLDLTKRLETIILLLLGTFAAAQKEFVPEQTQTASDFIEKLLHNWTFQLERNADSIKEN